MKKTKTFEALSAKEMKELCTQEPGKDRRSNHLRVLTAAEMWYIHRNRRSASITLSMLN